MNGWFMWYPQQFPPRNNVNPLYISFHLTPSEEANFFTEDTIAHLKKYEPIGARDLNTVQMMKNHGINSYFSGCLTLTLNNSYYNKIHTGNIIICEPYIELGSTKKNNKYFRKIFALSPWIRKTKFMCVLYKRYYHNNLEKSVKGLLLRMLEVAAFYQTYSELFDDIILLKAEYTTHLVDNYTTVEQKFKMADDLLRRYANAKMMITSRIHAGLPCLAFETPTIFITSKELADSDTIRKGGRFGGLLDFFNYATYNKGELEYHGNLGSSKIGLDNIPKNPDNYKKYQKLLDTEVRKYIANTNKE